MQSCMIRTYSPQKRLHAWWDFESYWRSFLLRFEGLDLQTLLCNHMEITFGIRQEASSNLEMTSIPVSVLLRSDIPVSPQGSARAARHRP